MKKKTVDNEFSGSSDGVSDCSVNNDNREHSVFTFIENGNLSGTLVASGEHSGDKFPELYIEPEEPQESFDFTGRRKVDIQYLFKCLQSLKHESFNCTFSDVEITNEKRIGFCGIFTSKCKMCNKVDTLSTEDLAKEQLDITTAAVSAPNAISHDRLNPSNVPDTLTLTAELKSSTNRPSSAEQTPDKQPESRPGCLWMADSMPPNPCASPQPSCSKFPCASPKNILPVLNVKPEQKRIKLKQGNTAIVRASPYKPELEQVATAKKLKNAKGKSKLIPKAKKCKATSTKKSTQKTVKQQPRQNRQRLEPEKTSDSSEDDAACSYCDDLYLKSNEGWASCIKCKKWAHSSCAGIDSENNETMLTCALCQPA
ncbi:hypothetical protein FQA39_LY03661 [Lamprigera yunnana]|nr:hypothetical protein FQA39_LY03661 [Lamprigera yunnana]